jgi:integrase
MSIHKYATPKGGTRYRVMWRDETNRQRSKTVETLAEARRLDASTKLGAAPTPIITGGMTLRDWFVQWFRAHGPEWATTTLKRRKSIYDCWIDKQLGDMPIARITGMRIREYRVDVLASGATEKTANQAHSVLSAAMTAARDEGLIESNPCLGVKRLKTLPTNRRALTPLEVEQIRDQMPTARDQLIVSLLAYAGLRPGELCGLQWKHVTDRHIRVEQSAQSGIIVRTKTGKTRLVNVGKILRGDIAEYGRGEPDELVVPGLRGGILHWKNWFRRIWVPAAEAAGIDARPYDLRHTFASLLIHSGMTIPEVALELGHANPNMTLGVYAHVYQEAHGSKRRSLDGAVRRARLQQAENRQAAALAAQPQNA